MFIGIAVTPLAQAIAGAYTPPSSDPKTFSVTLSGITGATPSSVSAIVTIYQTPIIPRFSVNGTTSASGVAPFYVHCDASETLATTLTNYPFHNLLYRWRFGDEDGSKWQQGTEAGNESKNEAWGPVSAHVYWTAGERTITLDVFGWNDGGTMFTATLTKTITITAQDTVFASNTVYVSDILPVAGVDGVPVGANVATVTTAANFNTVLATYKRVFVRAGRSFNLGGSINFPNTTNGGVFTKYGSGANPMFIMSTDASPCVLNTVNGWRIYDVDFDDNGTYGANKNPFTLTAGGHHLIARSNVLACRIGLGSEDVAGLCIYECDITGMYDDSLGEPGIGLFPSRTTRLAILGTNSYDSPITHVARVQGVKSCVISHSRFAKAGPTRNALSVREWTTTGFDHGGQSTHDVYLSCNIVDNSERGGYALYCGPQSVGHSGYLENLIAERNYCVGTDLYPANFAVANFASVRHNILRTRYSYAIGLGLGGNAAGSPPSVGVWVYNNTAYKPDVALSTHFSFVSFTDAGLASDVRISNNLIYAPGNTSDGATNGTQATLLTNGGTSPGVENTNYFLAANSSTAQINSVRPWASTTPTAYADYTPSVYGVSGGADVGSRIDFFGDLLTGARDLGAINV